MQQSVSLLRVEDVARRLGLGVSTVWEYARTGLLPRPLRPSKKISVWPDDEIGHCVASIVKGDTLEDRRNLVKRLMRDRQNGAEESSYEH